jgi:predicted NBD/HSP70 family sugar kinase
VLVAAGTGIGGAIMLARKIWRGAQGTAGSLGWLSAFGGKDDADHGPFEQVASGTALSQAARAYRPGWTGENLVTAARAGDTGAAAVADRFGRHFGRGLAAVASVLDPEMIIIAGGLCDAMDVLSPSIDRAMLECASPNGRHVPVRAAAFGPHAGVVGALLATKLDKEFWL